MRKAINRRTVLKSAGAVIGTSAVGIAVASKVMGSEQHPDAKLIELGKAWKRQRDTYYAALSAFCDAEDNAAKEYPEPPEAIKYGVFSTRKQMTRDDIERAYNFPLDNPTERDAAEKLHVRERRINALDEWEAVCKAVDAKHSTDELEQKYIAEGDAFNAIEKEIRQTPAHTVEGILVKLIAWREYQCPSDLDNIITGFVDSALEDAKRISGQTGGQHV